MSEMLLNYSRLNWENSKLLIERDKKIIEQLKGAREEIEESNEAFIEKYMEAFIEDHEEEIYICYCKMYPEYITSDFTLEDVDDIWEFVEDYMQEDFENYIDERRRGEWL